MTVLRFFVFLSLPLLVRLRLVQCDGGTTRRILKTSARGKLGPLPFGLCWCACIKVSETTLVMGSAAAPLYTPLPCRESLDHFAGMPGLLKKLAHVVVLVFIHVIVPQCLPLPFCIMGKSHVLASALGQGMHRSDDRMTGCSVLLTILCGDFSGISDKVHGSAVEVG